MAKLLKYLFFFFFSLPAICLAQLNSDYNLIQKKKIKEVVAYNVLKNSANSAKVDTVFKSYSYDTNGKLIGIKNLQRDETRNYFKYDGNGNLLYLLNFGNEAAGHNNTDTGGFYQAKYDSNNNCTYQFNLGYSYGGGRSVMILEAYRTDSGISYPPNYSDTSAHLFKDALYVKQYQDLSEPNGSYLIIQKHDTIFYYEINWDNSISKYFIVTNETNAGYIARIYSIKEDSVFYYGVSLCITSESYGMTIIDTAYNFVFNKNITDFYYDPSLPKLENKIEGEFVKGAYFAFWPRTLKDFLAVNLDSNGKLQHKIDRTYEPFPPYTKQYRESKSLKRLKKEYKYVFITERYK